MTTQQKITKAEGDITRLNVISGGIGALGSVTGLVYAVRAEKSGWAMLGYFILGGMVASAGSYLVLAPKVTKLQTEINILKEGGE